MQYYDRMLQVLHRWRQQLLISNKFISMPSRKIRIKSPVISATVIHADNFDLSKVGVKYQAVVRDAGWQAPSHPIF